jgi:hypothetical protein
LSWRANSISLPYFVNVSPGAVGCGKTTPALKNEWGNSELGAKPKGNAVTKSELGAVRATIREFITD